MRKRERQLKKTVLLPMLFLFGIAGDLFYNPVINIVEAHPINEIKINEGTANEYKIPKDSTSQQENHIPIIPQMVQGKGSVTNYKKSTLETFSDSTVELSQGYTDLKKTPNGNYISVYTDTDYGFESNVADGTWRYNTAVVLFDKNGKEIRRVWVGPYGNVPHYEFDAQLAVPLSATRLYEEHNDITNTSTYTVIARTGQQVFSQTFDQELVGLEYNNISSPASLENRGSNYISFTNGSYIQLTSVRKDTIQTGPLPNQVVAYPFIKGGQPSSTNMLKFGVPANLDQFSNNKWSSAEGHRAFIEFYDVIQISGGFVGLLSLQILTNSGGVEGYPVIVMWDNTGAIKETIGGNTPSFKLEISDFNTVYFDYVDSQGRLNIMSYSTIGGLVRRGVFPPGTSLQIRPSSISNDEYMFMGRASTFSGSLNGWGNEPSIIFGTLKKSDLSVASLTPFDFDTDIHIASVAYENDRVLFSGQNVITPVSNVINYKNNFIHPKLRNDFFGAFSGKIEFINDYLPLIYTKDIELNLDSSAAEIDKKLLSDIKVYDTYDMSTENVSGQKSLKWLENRINKNINVMPYDNPSDPEDPVSLPIDWKALGFNNKEVGPQNVTYFITDSQRQVTSTSRWINAETKSTIKDGNLNYDAHNIVVKLTDIQNQLNTDEKVKKLIKSMAWDSTNHEIYEQSSTNTFDNSIISLDPNQLGDIRNATIAKPYPLDVKIKGKANSNGNGTTAGKSLTKRVWVFITNDNTTVDNGVVLYADDFTLPLKEASTATPETLLKKMKFKQTQPNVVAYDYVAQPQDKKELVPLSKGKTDGITKGLSSPAISMNQLTNTTGAMTIPNFDFTYTNPADTKTTTVKVTVTVDEQKEFCFKLERTKEALSIVEPIVDSSISGNYQSIEVKVPLHVTMDSSLTLPANWQAFPVVTDTVSNTYQYNMKTKNDKQSLEEFLDAVKFTIGLPVDKPGEVMITLREDELLAKTPPLIKSAKGKSLRSSQVIETNDFRLSVENKWDDTDEVNYVDLKWDAIPNLANSGYRLMQSSDEGGHWEERSLKYGKSINVLNIYPNIAGSNTLKSWMDNLNLINSEGENLIKVTAVSMTSFNLNAESYLKDTEGNYKYDVVMIGSYDTNYGADLTPSSVAHVKKYIDLGYGVLFGHDTVTWKNHNLLTLQSYLGVDGTPGVSPEPASYTGSSKVKVTVDGYLMKYPFEMPNGVILTIPAAHSVQMAKQSTGTNWMMFDKPYTIGNPNGIVQTGDWITGWYLRTNGNVGMIQTGHSNGQSTIDERKIIANTLYNLAQVSIDNHGQDYTVKDDVPPEVKTVTRDFNNRVTIDGQDYGKNYQYYVTADTKDKGTLKSDVVEEVVTSDIKGYIYLIDTEATTIPPVIKDAFGKVTNINAPVVNPEVSREATISGFTSNDEWLHVVPIDRANNVGEVKHIQIKEVDYTEPPEFVFCRGTLPQKIYIKGKDDQGNALPSGNQTLETALRIDKEETFSETILPWYSYVKLTKPDGTVISPEVMKVTGTKQDFEAVYTRSLTTLHVRQVILDSVIPLVEPLRGEGVLQNTDTLGGTTQASLPVVYPTRDEALAGFKTVTYEVDTAEPFYTLESIVPEYYHYVGHVLTDTNVAHLSGAKVAGVPKWDITGQPEVWVTLYLAPNDSGGKTPGLYGWNYGNDDTYTLVP